jgi:peptidoglycan hydrolase CwlO-like protein
VTGLSHIAQSERSDVEALENEVHELGAELERVRAELADERQHRTNLEAAIEEHRRAIRERVPQKSGRKIDEALWWWVQ